MPRQRHRWSPICDPPKGLVVPVPIDPAGVNGPTRGRARGPRWRQTSPGLYVPAGVDAGVPEQRILEASRLLPEHGAVTGWGSLRIRRGNFFDGLLPDGRTEMPVRLIIGPGLNRGDRPGIRYSRDRLGPDELVVRHGIRITREERALFDEMRAAPDVREAVVVADMGAAAEITSIRRMRVFVAAHEGWKGVRQVRAALDLAEEDSRSPNETRTRLVWQIDAGFPRPLVNQEVWDLDGRLLGIADLLDPVAGVVGEFDGADHRGALRQSKDIGRETGLRDHGLEFFRVMGLDLASPSVVARRMQSTRARALWLPEGQRKWTITPPPGRERAPSLDEILDERDWHTELHRRWEREGDPDVRGLTNP